MPVEQTKIWTSGEDGYHTYRIPALAVAVNGDVLAFCEGRRASSHDQGEIDLLMKSSADGGRTWSDQRVIWNDTLNTCGNPCPVVDEEAGVVWLLSTWNRGDDTEPQIIAKTSRDTRRVFALCSQDNGETWSVPREVTDKTKKPEWTWYATGPGAGIQIKNGPYRGRLIIPCDHIVADSNCYYSHVIYSDDHGTSWQLGGRSPMDQVNECEVVELTDGALLLNMRNYDSSRRNRQVAMSRDGGLTWGGQRFDDALIEPICQASIRRAGKALSETNPIVFSNPASIDKRVNMTVRTSLDDGVSWPFSHVLHSGPSGYSCLALLADGVVACLYECGDEVAYETLQFARFDVTQVK